jgi:hypothetical protein
LQIAAQGKIGVGGGRWTGSVGVVHLGYFGILLTDPQLPYFARLNQTMQYSRRAGASTE